tara:strand:- start:885 stop:2045 length:1161 start_codon:yes stop_codon:yes gene_type:complete
MLHEPDKLKRTLTQTIARVIILNHQDVIESYEGFFTMCARDDEIYSLSLDNAPEEPEDHVVMWDLLKKKFCVVKYSDIGVWTYFYNTEPMVDDKGDVVYDTESGEPVEIFVPDTQRALNHFKLICDEIDDCECCDTIDCCRDDLIDLICCARTDTINEQLITWKTLKFFDFKCKNIEQLCCCERTDKMHQLHDAYMNKIRKYRAFVFEELDEEYDNLKSNGGTTEELQHIEGLRQQLRDIPQVTDMSCHDTILKLVNFWPAILGKRPEEWSVEMNSCVLGGDIVLDLATDTCTKACSSLDIHENEEVHDPLLDSILSWCTDLSGLIDYRDKCLAIEKLTTEQQHIVNTNPMYMDALSGYEFIVPEQIINEIDKRIIFLKDQNQTNK